MVEDGRMAFAGLPQAAGDLGSALPSIPIDAAAIFYTGGVLLLAA